MGVQACAGDSMSRLVATGVSGIVLARRHELSHMSLLGAVRLQSLGHCLVKHPVNTLRSVEARLPSFTLLPHVALHAVSFAEESFMTTLDGRTPLPLTILLCCTW